MVNKYFHQRLEEGAKVAEAHFTQRRLIYVESFLQLLFYFVVSTLIFVFCAAICTSCDDRCPAMCRNLKRNGMSSKKQNWGGL